MYTTYIYAYIYNIYGNDNAQRMVTATIYLNFKIDDFEKNYDFVYRNIKSSKQMKD